MFETLLYLAKAFMYVPENETRPHTQGVMSEHAIRRGSDSSGAASKHAGWNLKAKGHLTETADTAIRPIYRSQAVRLMRLFVLNGRLRNNIVTLFRRGTR